MKTSMQSCFFGELHERHLESRWGQLLTPLGYYSAKYDVTVCAPARFVLDFESVPRLPVTYLIAGNTGKWESVPHDLLYRFGLLPRLQADYVYYEAGRVRSQMRSNQSWLYRAGRLLRTSAKSCLVAAAGWAYYAPLPGCLDYRNRKKCHQVCRIDQTKCENFYPNWRQCMLPGYRPDVLDMHR